MKNNRRYSIKIAEWSSDARARVRLLAELLGVVLAMLLLAASLALAAKSLCADALQSTGNPAASTHWACGAARFIDAVLSNVEGLAGRSTRQPEFAQRHLSWQGCRAA